MEELEVPQKGENCAGDKDVQDRIGATCISSAIQLILLMA